eukprot:1480347-Rhodomonas_salina.3
MERKGIKLTSEESVKFAATQTEGGRVQPFACGFSPLRILQRHHHSAPSLSQTLQLFLKTCCVAPETSLPASTMVRMLGDASSLEINSKLHETRQWQ